MTTTAVHLPRLLANIEALAEYVADTIGCVDEMATAADATTKLGDAAITTNGVAMLGLLEEVAAQLDTARSTLANSLIRHVAHYPSRGRDFGGWRAELTNSKRHQYDGPRLVSKVGAALAEEVLVDGNNEPVPPSLAVQQACRIFAEMVGADTTSAAWKEGGRRSAKRGLMSLGINPNDYRDTTETERLKARRIVAGEQEQLSHE